MANLNKVLLMGNLTRDPELRYTSGGQPVCNFTLAVSRQWNDKQSGEKKEETTFVRITVWGKQGENCAQYLSKGRAAFVEGRLQTRSWETEDGQKRSATDVVADNVQFLGAKGGAGGDKAEKSEKTEAEVPEGAPAAEDDIPF